MQTPSSLMFAKFSPDGEQVAYVHADNIYVESLSSSAIDALTKDGKDGIINGLFDWVYEEEFIIRDGFRWSPDGQHIAYWQLDTSGSKDFIMINNTDTLYPTITKFPYPKVGETNALAKVAIVNLETKKTLWPELPNNSREMYIPRMNWAGNSDAILIQHVNRKQDTNLLYLADAKTGNTRHVFTEKEEHFLDFYDDAHWLDGGEDFIWTSERSGWRHFYKVSRDGSSLVNLTDGNFDVTGLQAIDQTNGWLYFIASPDDVAQRYLYRSKLDGSVLNQRVTPNNFSGSNNYYMSDNGQWAIHYHSSFTEPTQIRLVAVDGHETKHTLMDNKALRDKLATFEHAKTEFSK